MEQDKSLREILGDLQEAGVPNLGQLPTRALYLMHQHLKEHEELVGRVHELEAQVAGMVAAPKTTVPLSPSKCACPESEWEACDGIVEQCRVCGKVRVCP